MLQTINFNYSLLNFIYDKHCFQMAFLSYICNKDDGRVSYRWYGYIREESPSTTERRTS